MTDQPPSRGRFGGFPFGLGLLVGLLVGIPLGAVGLILLLQIVTAMIALP